ncbi:hypothetical protein [Mycobacterium kyorinense]|nr:hypothetical protein [Mycobacterium kyorinense]
MSITASPHSRSTDDELAPAPVGGLVTHHTGQYVGDAEVLVS